VKHGAWTRDVGLPEKQWRIVVRWLWLGLFCGTLVILHLVFGGVP
jgi:hypothetical protein